jgi:redox-sensitive bicupin YhaK (pirin superfamily)
VLHSEFNHSKSDVVHFLQIWIVPERARLEPSYEQKQFSVEERKNQLRLIASRDGREGSITVHQDVAIHAAVLDEGATASLAIAPGRHAWVQVARGSIELNGKALGEGDGASLSDERKIELRGKSPAEVLVFDLA